VIAAVGEAQREPVERPAAGEVRFKLDRAGRVVDRPVDRRPARVVQRRGVHAISGHGGTRHGHRGYRDDRDDRTTPPDGRRRRPPHDDGRGVSFALGSDKSAGFHRREF